jgi:hypothetical protein
MASAACDHAGLIEGQLMSTCHTLSGAESELMDKAKPPVFHVPVGRHRENSEVVLFNDDADQAAG